MILRLQLKKMRPGKQHQMRPLLRERAAGVSPWPSIPLAKLIEADLRETGSTRLNSGCRPTMDRHGSNSCFLIVPSRPNLLAKLPILTPLLAFPLRTRQMILWLLLLATLTSLQAQFNCTTNNGSITITGYTGTGGAVTIPSIVNGLPVTSIGAEAFYALTNLTSITIPGSVTNIGAGSFAFCTNLTNATMDNGVINIGIEAFQSCGTLASVTIPSSVTSIGLYAFASSPEDPHNHALTSITIPESVTNLGEQAFQLCLALSSVYFMGNSPAAGSQVFYGDNVTVYYLPGTKGWSNTFAYSPSVPAVLWNPLIQASSSSFGVSNDQFGFNVTGTSNIPIVVEACANLANPVWTPLQTLLLTNGSFYFSEPFQPNIAARFYRISSP